MNAIFKRKVLLIVTAFLLFGLSLSSEAQFSKQKTKNIHYLKKVISDSLIITGQHCGNGNATEQGYRDYVEGLFRKTGKYPALIGLEYGYSPDNDLTLINSFGVRHAKKGGLVTVTWHADNPWQDGYNCRWNSVENKETIDFRKLLKDAPESEAKNNYRSELMKVGEGLKELQDAGIVVFWRPFHEMNGAWFWWGPDDLESPGNSEECRLLWEDMYETFTIDFGVENLIWIYSPVAVSGWSASIDAIYPGDALVDAVGVDIYSEKPEFKDYKTLKKFDKPIVVGEIGPLKQSYGNYDALQVLEELRGKAAWFLQWSSWRNANVAIVDNPNAKEMMNHPAAVTLEDLPKTLISKD